MALIKWSPFLLEPFDETDQSLEETRSSLVPAQQGAGNGLIPLVDVYEEGDAFIVEAPMPGMDPNKIELSIDQDILAIKAVHERKMEIDEKNYYRKEVRHGLVFRKIPLPAPVQEEAVEANYEDGVLKVRLPKRSDTQKRIPIEITTKP